MQAAARPTTIIDIVVPGTGIVRDLALVASFTLFVAVCAQIAIRLPCTPVPITGQTLAVLVTGGALGANRGAASLALYALIGSIGVPLFAPSAAALEGELIHFSFPGEGTGDLIWSLTSGGYIVGFIAAAYVVGRLAERGWDRGWKVTVAMLIGNVLVVLVDDAVLTVPVGVPRIATDDDSLPPSLAVIRLIENETIAPFLAVA